MTEDETVRDGESAILLRVRLTFGLIIRARLRLLVRSRLFVVLVVSGLLFPAAVSLAWSYAEGVPWLESSGSVLLVIGPIYALLGGALSVFGGLFHRQTRLFVRDGGEFAFTGEAMTARSKLTDSRLKWEACTSAVELREVFVLHVGVEQWLLPRASFAPGDVERFRALLRDRLGDRAKVAKDPA